MTLHGDHAARLAIQAGAAGIIVSNHGARQLDYVPSTIMALEEVQKLDDTYLRLIIWSSNYYALKGKFLLTILGFGNQVVKAAQGRVPVFMDGGVRRGTDVFKALALGASGIFVSDNNINT